MNPGQRILVLLIRAYRLVLSPAKTAFFGPLARCRFTPSCSEFALEAVRRHGAGRGARLSLRRLARCHPWNEGGHDPVPPSPERIAGPGTNTPERADRVPFREDITSSRAVCRGR